MRDSAQSARARIWQAWAVAFFACTALLVSNGVTISGITAFDSVLLGDFGWERGEYKIRESITLMFAGLLAPLAGAFLDRFGVRKCMLAGWSVLLLSQFIYSAADNLMLMYAIHALYAVVLVLCGLNACVILVSNWFVNQRGRAMGLMLVGSSLGGAIITQFNTSLLEHFAWQDVFRLGAIFPLALILLTWLWLRDAPDFTPAPAQHEDSGAAGGDEGMDYAEALKTGSFWMLTLIAMSTFFTVLGIQNNMRLHLLDLDFGEQGATSLFALFFFAAMAGKFLFGALSDRFSLRLVFNLNIGIMLLGCLLLASLDTLYIPAALLAFGFVWGGAYTMLQLSVVNIFGLKNAGKILGTVTVLDALGGGLGIYAVAAMQQASGDYQSGFVLCAGLIAFALLCFTRVRFRTVRGGAPAEPRA